jgi:hypothetical protein
MATPAKVAENGAATHIRLIAPSGRVEIDPLGLKVDATFVHPDIVEYAESGGLGSDTLFGLQGLLVAGIAASRNAGVYALREETLRATEGLRAVLGSESETLIRAAFTRAIGEDGEEGAFLPEVERIISEGAKSVETQALQLTKELKGAGEDGLPQIIEKRVRRASAEVVESILKAALGDDGALGIHLQNNGQAIKDLRGDLSKLNDLILSAKVAAEHVDPAAAGREWEPSVLAEVARLSLITGDRVEETGDQPAHGRSKKGDAVLHLANAKGESSLKVAIECRSGKERVTLADLRKAKDNRSAQATLLLASRACALPKDAEGLGFRAYWDERAVVLHHDPERPESGTLLATALQVARMFAQLAAAASADEINQDILRQSLSRIEKGLGRLKPLRSSATGIETEVSRIRGYAQDIEQELRGALGELSGLAAAA